MKTAVFKYSDMALMKYLDSIIFILHWFKIIEIKFEKFRILYTFKWVTLKWNYEKGQLWNVVAMKKATM